MLGLENKTLPGLVQWASSNFQGSTAVVDGHRTLNFEQLNQQRQQVAKSFMACGIKKGDTVAVWAPNMMEWMLAAIGLQSLGAILVPINTRLKGEEVVDLISRSKAKMLITIPDLWQNQLTDRDIVPLIIKLDFCIFLEGNVDGTKGVSWEKFRELGDSISLEQLQTAERTVKPEDTMDMIFTSGTTGRPKGVLSSHEQNISVFTTWVNTVKLSRKDRYLVVNPFFHTFGYKAGWLACLIGGATMIPMRQFQQKSILEKIQAHKISVLPSAPSLYEMLLREPHLQDYDLSSLRLAVTGAATIPQRLIRDIQEKLSFESVLTAYGLTESTGIVSMCQHGDTIEKIATTSGRAIDGVQIKCIDPKTLQEVASGQEGEIWVRGYNVMQGYYQMPNETQQAITDEGWLRTGDIGVLDDEGYLKITDRLKDMYIINGHNVYPAEVEQAIYRCEWVSQAAVVGMPKSPQGEVGVAFIVPKEGREPDRDGLKAHCEAILANYKLPYMFKFIESLPVNAAGKIQKLELRKMLPESQ